MHYRYALEKYKGTRTRYVCPACGQAGEFVRYVDTQIGGHLADHVGRCNREVNCGYHYTPKQYFADKGICPRWNESRHRQVVTPPEQASKPASFIPFDTFRKSLSRYGENNFIRYLHTLFRPETVSELVRRFYVGTSKHWEGAAVFWQVDVKGRIRSGKVMHYDPATGRRVRDVKPDGSKRSRITWAHSVLLKQGVFQDFKLRQCLFGEHQLAAQPRTNPVAVVEAEKTAIIATSYLPDLIWLACGSLTNLTADKCAVLAGRKVILFPDLNCLKKWHDKAKQLQALIDCSITVSDLLETRAAEADKEQGFDLADYLVSYDVGSGSPRSYGGWGRPA